MLYQMLIMGSVVRNFDMRLAQFATLLEMSSKEAFHFNYRLCKGYYCKEQYI
jgi:hypothetical protein